MCFAFLGLPCSFSVKILLGIHLISEWESFDDKAISKMASTAVKFWTKHKTALIALCDAHSEGE